MITEVERMVQDEALTLDAQIFEYSKAANPVDSGSTPRIPIQQFSAELYSSGASRVVPLDLSAQLRTSYLATSPSLLANFIRINAGDSLITDSIASSELYFVIRGDGHTETVDSVFMWKEGDFIVLPGMKAIHYAKSDTAIYMVSDSPLLAYLGVQKLESRFHPTLYSREDVAIALECARKDPDSSKRSRVSVLLANRNFEQTMTLTHTLWAMLGVVSPGTRQLPHRHQSVALDFVVKASPGAFTLLGPDLDGDGTIKDATRVDWVEGTAFITPPGYWHEHVNESNADAFVMPVQDAGLHTYLRTLDIRFYHED